MFLNDFLCKFFSSKEIHKVDDESYQLDGAFFLLRNHQQEWLLFLHFFVCYNKRYLLLIFSVALSKDEYAHLH